MYLWVMSNNIKIIIIIINNKKRGTTDCNGKQEYYLLSIVSRVEYHMMSTAVHSTLQTNETAVASVQLQ